METREVVYTEGSRVFPVAVFGSSVIIDGYSRGVSRLAQVMADPRQIELRRLASGEIAIIDLEEAAAGPLFFVAG